MLFWCNCFCSRFGTLGLGMMQKLAMTASILNFFSSAPSCSMQYGGEKGTTGLIVIGAEIFLDYLVITLVASIFLHTWL